MMVGSIKTNATEFLVQTRVSEIFFGKITDRKLDDNNNLQWKRVFDIYVANREKTNHFLTDPPSSIADAWTHNDIILLHQILTTVEPKIQDLILRCVTVKELSQNYRTFLGISMAGITTSIERMM